MRGHFAPYMASFGVSAGRVANLVIGVGTSVLIARILGPSQRGEFAAAAAIVAIGLQVCGLGLHASLPFFISMDSGLARPLLRRAIVLLLLTSSVWLVGALIWRRTAAADWLAAMPIGLVVVACAAVPAAGLLAFAQGAALGARRMHAFGWSDAFARCIAAALILSVLAAGLDDPDSRTISVMVCSAIASVVAGLALWHTLPPPTGLMAMPPIRLELGYAWRSAIACLLSTIPARWINVHLVEVGSRSEAGQFAVAMLVVDAVISVGSAFAGSRLADMARMAGGPGELRREAFRCAGILTGAGVFAILVVQFAAVPALGSVFGDAFLPAGPALSAMLAGMAMMPVATIFQIALAAGGMPILCLAGPGCSVGVTGLVILVVWPIRTAESAGWVFSLQALFFTLGSAMAFLLHEASRNCRSTRERQPMGGPPNTSGSDACSSSAGQRL